MIPEVKRVNLPEKDLYITIETGMNRGTFGYTSRINLHMKKTEIPHEQVAAIIGAVMEILHLGNHEETPNEHSG